MQKFRDMLRNRSSQGKGYRRCVATRSLLPKLHAPQALHTLAMDIPVEQMPSSLAEVLRSNSGVRGSPLRERGVPALEVFQKSWGDLSIEHDICGCSDGILRTLGGASISSNLTNPEFDGSYGMIQKREDFSACAKENSPEGGQPESEVAWPGKLADSVCKTLCDATLMYTYKVCKTLFGMISSAEDTI